MAETDSEPDTPDTDEFLDHCTPKEESSTRDDLLDQEDIDTDHNSEDDPAGQDFRTFRRMLLEKARQRDRANMRDDTDPEVEGPGPTAPSSPMRGLPLQMMQPPPSHHPPPGTPPAGPPQPAAAGPGITLRSGLQRLDHEEAQAIAQRMKAERQKKRAQAKQAKAATTD